MLLKILNQQALIIGYVVFFAVSCVLESKIKTPKSELPNFVLNPPMSRDIIYGIGYAKQVH